VAHIPRYRHPAGPALVPRNLEGDLRGRVLAELRRMSERRLRPQVPGVPARAPPASSLGRRGWSACRLLEETRLSLKAVAQRCVRIRSARWRRASMSLLGVPPAQSGQIRPQARDRQRSLDQPRLSISVHQAG